MSDFNKTWIFSTVSTKKTQIYSFIKIGPVEAELLHAGKQTDMTKLIVAFHNFLNAPKKQDIKAWNVFSSFSSGLFE